MFKYIYFIFFHFVSIFKCFKKNSNLLKCFFPLKKIFDRFFLFCYNFVSFYLFINNFFSSFLIWNFLCCFKKISSLVSLFFSTIFSFLKLVCSFWQIARLQEFFINYRIGSHKHLDKLLLSSWVVVVLLFHHLFLSGWGTWMDGWQDRWMERTTTQGYYISRLRDLGRPPPHAFQMLVQRNKGLGVKQKALGVVKQYKTPKFERRCVTLHIMMFDYYSGVILSYNIHKWRQSLRCTYHIRRNDNIDHDASNWIFWKNKMGEEHFWKMQRLVGLNQTPCFSAHAFTMEKAHGGRGTLLKLQKVGWTQTTTTLLFLGSCFYNGEKAHGWGGHYPKMWGWTQLPPHPWLLIWILSLRSCFLVF